MLACAIFFYRENKNQISNTTQIEKNKNTKKKKSRKKSKSRGKRKDIVNDEPMTKDQYDKLVGVLKMNGNQHLNDTIDLYKNLKSLDSPNIYFNKNLAHAEKSKIVSDASYSDSKTSGNEGVVTTISNDWKSTDGTDDIL